MMQWFHSLFSVSRIHDIWRLINALTATLMSVNKAVAADVFSATDSDRGGIEVSRRSGKKGLPLGTNPPSFFLNCLK